MFKIAFIDIDNTILDHNIHDFDFESINEIKKAKEKGIIIFLCTARNYYATKTTKILDLLNPDGVICSNGNLARTKKKVLYANIVPIEISKVVEKILNKHHLMAQFSSPYGSHLTNKPNKYMHSYFYSYKEKIPSVKKYDNKNITSMLMFAPIRYDEILKKEFPKEIELRRYSEFGCDLAYHFLDKGIGAKRILDYLGIDKKDAIGIGDSIDDVSLFKEVGLGVAMGHASEEIKEKASIVIDTISNHGVAKFFKELFK